MIYDTYEPMQDILYQFHDIPIWQEIFLFLLSELFPDELAWPALSAFMSTYSSEANISK